MRSDIIEMNSVKRKKPTKNELPKRYRCRDKYNRALDLEINKFVTKTSDDGNDEGPRVVHESERPTIEPDTR